MPGADLIKNSEKYEKSTSSPFSVSSVGSAFQPEHMKTSLEVRELLLLPFMRACADTWSTLWLQGADCWLYLRMEVSLFPNIHADPDEVLSGICYPVNSVATWTVPSVISPAVSSILTLFCLQFKSSMSQKNLTATWDGLACALHSQYPPSCDEAESTDFPGSPEQEETWENCSRSGSYLPVPTGNHQLPREFQASRSIVGPLSL